MNAQPKNDTSPLTPDGQSLASSACSLLERDGWRECPDQFRKTARCFYKRFETPTRCRCNDDKAGMQVCVAVSHYDKWWSYEIDLHGELPDGTWIKLHNHGMPPEIEAGLATIPRLLATWEFIAANGGSVESEPSDDFNDCLVRDFVTDSEMFGGPYTTGKSGMIYLVLDVHNDSVMWSEDELACKVVAHALNSFIPNEKDSHE